VDFRAALLDQTRLFGVLIGEADPETPVPTCPDWTMKQLFRHVGRGHRWAAQIIADRLQQELDPRNVHDGKPPEEPDAAIAWLNDGAQLIIDAVDRVGSDARVWTFIGTRPAGWWIRRRLHEALVHRADAALALGRTYDLAPELAADGVSEWLERVAVEAKGHTPALDPGQSMHLHATESELGPTGEWTVVNDEEGMWWSHAHGEGSVALRGPAKELLLTLVRRRTTADAGVEVFGDTTVWDTWLARTPF